MMKLDQKRTSCVDPDVTRFCRDGVYKLDIDPYELVGNPRDDAWLYDKI
jgi:hypothetical protein